MEKKVNKLSELVSKDEVVKRLGLGAKDKVWSITSLILAFVDKYGDDAWEIAKKFHKERGQRNALRMEKLMKEAGANFNDPRDWRRYLRENVGFWGYVEHTDDEVVTKPDGKIRIEYRITKCPFPETWNEMGLSKELQLKLDTMWGFQTDTISAKHFNLKYECDQGLPQGRSYCKFVVEKL